MKKIVLIDTLAIIYRSYYAIPDLTTQSGKSTGALYGLALTVLKILKEFKPDYVLACYDLPEPTHRQEEYGGYKQSRELPEDDLIEQIEESRNFFAAFNIPIREKAGFEADDIIGTISEQLKEELNVVIVTGDKDLLQLLDKDRVKVLLLKKGIKETMLLDEKEAEKQLGFSPKLLTDFKGLRGDPSDEIPGVAGIGDKWATKLIQEFNTVENIYKSIDEGEVVFKDKGISDSVISKLEQGRKNAIMSKDLATIHRDVPTNISLPEKGIFECINQKDVLNYLIEFEFSSLVPKAESVLGGTNNNNNHKVDENKGLLKEAAILFWLLDSEKTEALRDEILATTRTTSLEEACNKLLLKVKEEGMEYVWEQIEKPLISITEEMKNTGIKIDKKYLNDLSLEYGKRIEKLEREIKTHSGVDFNISSPKQLGEVLFDRLNLKTSSKTSKGARSTKENELLKLKGEHPVIELILEYRKLKKLVTTYITPLPKLADKKDRIHGSFVQNGTATGRMSSHSPNMQNIPKHGEEGKRVRSAFICDEGNVLMAFDYSQMELRLAAAYSGDESMLEVFRKNGDVHKDVASKIFNVSADDVTPEMRDRAKTINFGVIYGMGARALSTNLEIPLSEAKVFLEEYKRNFPMVFVFFDAVRKMALDKGYVETMFGRRRITHGIHSRLPSIRSRAERIAINAPIQGTGADIIKIAMVKISDYLKDKKTKMILQVHDELVFEVPESDIKQVAEDIHKLMQIKLPKGKEVDLVVDTSYGKNWCDLKKMN